MAGAGGDLTPYVPRVVVDWLRLDLGARSKEIDGTLAFVDLSGFTAMSERLASLGKAGAEELTDVINGTFSRLLEVAYANGGGLLKFGGDALLLFFDGDQHADRAATAAYGMRRTLREIGRPRTSVGTVQLRMHVGIHTGTFRFFLVGATHRELIVTGPNVTETVKMEASAEAGEILLSDVAAAAVPERALGERRNGGRFLRKDVGAAARPAEPVATVDPDLLAQCVPAAVRGYVSSGKVEPEHRQATVAFVRFSGTDALVASGDATDALDEVVTAVQLAADEHAVTCLESDIDQDGGRIVLVAGAPETGGNDEERMLRALRAVADAGTRVTVCAGVHRGRVFAGEVGAPFRRTYTILGETAALAARLMARATPGQILATDDVLERSRTRFETVELDPFPVKGKSEPIVAHDVRGVIGVRAAEPARELPFVGRERELAVIGAALAPVRMGYGSLVELTGEPGMGKSRLVEELRAQCADLAVVLAACEQYEQSTPYFPFRGLLRGLLEISSNGDRATTERLNERLEDVDGELVPWAPLVGMVLGADVASTREVDELQPAFRRARLHGAVEELLSKLLPSPTLIIFEDVHWMDESSAELLRHLGLQVSRKPWLVCATRRPAAGGFAAAEGAPPVPALALTLEPLTEDAAAALVGAAAGDGFDADVAAITERAGGNPLFLQELVAAPGVEGETAAALPENVESMVATRIDKLDPSDRILLRYAAVVGATFSGELIADVLADDPSASLDSDAWERLVEFVERDPYTAGAFRFRHALFRDAAYEGLSYRRRRELHSRVGEAYERRAEAGAEDAPLLSLHFFHAQQWEKAYRYSLLAGDQARAKFANADAASFYRRALDVGRHVPELARDSAVPVWEALGDVLELSGDYGEAANAYRSARRLAAKEGAEPPVLLWKEGLLRERAGRYGEALRWYSRGLKAAPAIPDGDERRRLVEELELAYAGVRLRQGHFSDCIDWCEKAVEAAGPAQDLPALAHAYYLMHLAYTSLGSPEKAAFRGLALPIYEDLGDLLGQANVLNNLGIDAYYDGRWDEALDLYERSKELRERIGDVVGAATIVNNIGEIRSDQGHFAEAEEHFYETLDVCERTGYRYMANLATSNLGRAALRAGRLDEVDALLTKALAAFEEIRATSFVLETRARLAEYAAYARRPDEAIRLADETLAAASSGGGTAGLFAMLHRIRGYGLAQQGAFDDAAQAFAESERVAREAGAAYELALALEASARVADLTGGDAAAADAESQALFAQLAVVEHLPPAL